MNKFNRYFAILCIKNSILLGKNNKNRKSKIKSNNFLIDLLISEIDYGLLFYYLKNQIFKIIEKEAS